MEKALKYELERRISGLTVYPTNAPKSSPKPYLVYVKSNSDRDKTLDGYTDKQATTYMFSTMATEYDDMKSLTDQVEAFLIGLPETTIGEELIFVEDLEINNIDETYEYELGKHRGIIDVTIFY